MTIQLPESLTYGKVVGRFLRAVGDTSADVDNIPDGVAATGSVTFTPALVVSKEPANDPQTAVIRDQIPATLDSQGYLTDPAGNRGIWLVAGVYKVAYNISGVTIPGHNIEILASHTELAPLRLIANMTSTGAVLTVSQYSELSGRIDTLNTVSVDTDGTPIVGTDRLVTEPSLQDPTSPAGVYLNSTFERKGNGGGKGVSRVLTKLLTGEAVKVTYIGDSGLEGSTATAGLDTASRVKTTLDARFGVTTTKSNRAVSGRTPYYSMSPAHASPTSFALALADRADLYVIAYGHNDIRSEVGAAYLPGTGYPQAAAQAAVEHMVRRIRVDVPGADIIISNEWPYTGTAAGSNAALEQHGNRLRRLAASYGCGFIDYYQTLVDLGVGTGSDDTYVWPTGSAGAQHPNDEGHRVWAELITDLLPSDANPAPESPTLPAPMFGAERYTHQSWVAMADGARSAGTSGYRRVGSWSGGVVVPVTTTAGDKIDAQFIGSEVAFRIDTGTGQGHVKIEVNGAVLNSDLDLSALGTGQSWLPVTGLGVGVHRVVVTVLSGSITFRGVSYLPALGQRTPYTSGLITYTGTWTTLGADNSHFEGNAKQTATANDSVTITFVGTGLWLAGYRYAAAVNIGVTVDGGTESVTDWNSGGTTTQQGGKLVVSGLEYGRHTVTIRLVSPGRALQVSTFLAFDERRTERPTRMAGVALTADQILTSTPLPAIPTVRLSADDSTATAPPYPSALSASGFTVNGTAAAKASWELETGRIAY